MNAKYETIKNSNYYKIFEQIYDPDVFKNEFILQFLKEEKNEENIFCVFIKHKPTNKTYLEIRDSVEDFLKNKEIILNKDTYCLNDKNNLESEIKIQIEDNQINFINIDFDKLILDKNNSPLIENVYKLYEKAKRTNSKLKLALINDIYNDKEKWKKYYNENKDKMNESYIKYYEYLLNSNKFCFKCGKYEKLLKCGKCKKAYYCNKECQKLDYKYHKIYCNNNFI